MESAISLILQIGKPTGLCEVPHILNHQSLPVFALKALEMPVKKPLW